MTAPYKARKTQKGFTIAEALISVAILAGIAATLFPILFGSTRAVERVYSSFGTQEDKRITKKTLQTLGAQMIAPDKSIKDSAFAGLPHKINFLTYSPSGQLIEAELYFQRNRNEKNLFLKINPHGQVKASHDINLTTVPAFTKISYYGQSKENGNFLWHHSWTSKELPKLIRIEDKTNGFTPGETFRLDIPISVSGPLNCFFDPVSRQCRKS